MCKSKRASKRWRDERLRCGVCVVQGGSVISHHGHGRVGWPRGGTLGKRGTVREATARGCAARRERSDTARGTIYLTAARNRCTKGEGEARQSRAPQPGGGVPRHGIVIASSRVCTTPIVDFPHRPSRAWPPLAVRCNDDRGCASRSLAWVLHFDGCTVTKL
jgi:hypothetical protein